MTEPTAAQRKIFAKMKLAMPDGSYYIRNGAIGAVDLDNAIKAVGRTTSASGDAAAAAVRRHIMTRAKALGLSSKIPDTWNPDGTLKQLVSHADVDVFLEHFGIKGMKWGVRRSTSGGGGHPISSDAAKAIQLRGVVGAHGVHALSNTELQHLVTRLNLEQQHARLSPESNNVKKGHEFVKTALSISKTGLDAYNTASQVKKAVDELRKSLK